MEGQRAAGWAGKYSPRFLSRFVSMFCSCDSSAQFGLNELLHEQKMTRRDGCERWAGSWRKPPKTGEAVGGNSGAGCRKSRFGEFSCPKRLKGFY